MSNSNAILVLPRLQVQNANAISSPMTWGFPAISAFIGLMHALERRLAKEDIGLIFDGIGVVCHRHDAQVTQGGFVRAFHLTRNPVDKAGKTAAIVEEGRIHLEVTLVLTAQTDTNLSDEQRQVMARQVMDIVTGMRIAGGSVMPPLPGQARRPQPTLMRLDDDAEKRSEQFSKLRYRWLPGFALVSRDELLTQRLNEMQQAQPAATELDAWLDLLRLNHECRPSTITNAQSESDEKAASREEVSWEIRRSPGWLVPMPVGYGALGELYDPGSVANARDTTTPFRFVESLYSIGQWISPHRLKRVDDLVWYVDNDLDKGIYRLRNDYQPSDVDSHSDINSDTHNETA